MKTTMTTAVVMAVLAMGLGSAEAAAAKKPPKQVSGVVNLNQATAQQLDLLPGVGAKAAQRILDYRKKTPFSRPEEIVKVKGFGKKKFEKLKVHLAVAGPTTLKLLAAGEPRTEQGRASPATR
jgi:competence protein ComEA